MQGKHMDTYAPPYLARLESFNSSCPLRLINVPMDGGGLPRTVHESSWDSLHHTQSRLKAAAAAAAAAAAGKHGKSHKPLHVQGVALGYGGFVQTSRSDMQERHAGATSRSDKQE